MRASSRVTDVCLNRYSTVHCAVIAKHIRHNYAMMLRTWFTNGHSSHGATHLGWELEKSVGYVNTVFGEYLEYGGLAIEALEGRSVVEVGPADNLGVALEFIAAGAEQIVAIEKGHPVCSLRQAREIYQALRHQHSGEALKRFDLVRQGCDGAGLSSENVQLLVNCAIEDAVYK